MHVAGDTKKWYIYVLYDTERKFPDSFIRGRDGEGFAICGHLKLQLLPLLLLLLLMYTTPSHIDARQKHTLTTIHTHTNKT